MKKINWENENILRMKDWKTERMRKNELVLPRHIQI
jgi:hypothetical protein